jgi:hypothetical protein
MDKLMPAKAAGEWDNLQGFLNEVDEVLVEEETITRYPCD